MSDISVKAFHYMPVFVGQTEDNQKVVLYKELADESKLYIKLADGELWALSPGTEVEMWFDMGEDRLNLRVVAIPLAPHWQGRATGTRRDLIEEDGLR